jgi:hypothetical protein
MVQAVQSRGSGPNPAEPLTERVTPPGTPLSPATTVGPRPRRVREAISLEREPAVLRRFQYLGPARQAAERQLPGAALGHVGSLPGDCGVARPAAGLQSPGAALHPAGLPHAGGGVTCPAPMPNTAVRLLRGPMEGVGSGVAAGPSSTGAAVGREATPLARPSAVSRPEALPPTRKAFGPFGSVGGKAVLLIPRDVPVGAALRPLGGTCGSAAALRSTGRPVASAEERSFDVSRLVKAAERGSTRERAVWGAALDAVARVDPDLRARMAEVRPHALSASLHGGVDRTPSETRTSRNVLVEQVTGSGPRRTLAEEPVSVMPPPPSVGGTPAVAPPRARRSLGAVPAEWGSLAAWVGGDEGRVQQADRASRRAAAGARDSCAVARLAQSSRDRAVWGSALDAVARADPEVRTRVAEPRPYRVPDNLHGRVEVGRSGGGGTPSRRGFTAAHARTQDLQAVPGLSVRLTSEAVRIWATVHWPDERSIQLSVMTMLKWCFHDPRSLTICEHEKKLMREALYVCSPPAAMKLISRVIGLAQMDGIADVEVVRTLVAPLPDPCPAMPQRAPSAVGQPARLDAPDRWSGARGPVTQPDSGLSVGCRQAGAAGPDQLRSGGARPSQSRAPGVTEDAPALLDIADLRLNVSPEVASIWANVQWSDKSSIRRRLTMLLKWCYDDPRARAIREDVEELMQGVLDISDARAAKEFIKLVIQLAWADDIDAEEVIRALAVPPPDPRPAPAPPTLRPPPQAIPVARPNTGSGHNALDVSRLVRAAEAGSARERAVWGSALDAVARVDPEVRARVAELRPRSATDVQQGAVDATAVGEGLREPRPPAGPEARQVVRPAQGDALAPGGISSGSGRPLLYYPAGLTADAGRHLQAVAGLSVKLTAEAARIWATVEWPDERSIQASVAAMMKWSFDDPRSLTIRQHEKKLMSDAWYVCSPPAAAKLISRVIDLAQMDGIEDVEVVRTLVVPPPDPRPAVPVAAQPEGGTAPACPAKAQGAATGPVSGPPVGAHEGGAPALDQLVFGGAQALRPYQGHYAADEEQILRPVAGLSLRLTAEAARLWGYVDWPDEISLLRSLTAMMRWCLDDPRAHTIRQHEDKLMLKLSHLCHARAAEEFVSHVIAMACADGIWDAEVVRALVAPPADPHSEPAPRAPPAATQVLPAGPPACPANAPGGPTQPPHPAGRARPRLVADLRRGCLALATDGNGGMRLRWSQRDGRLPPSLFPEVNYKTAPSALEGQRGR